MTTRITSTYGLPSTTHATRDAALAAITARYPDAVTLDVDGEPDRTLVWSSQEEMDADTSGGSKACAEMVSTADITVEVGRHTIDPQGLASDEENAAIEEHIVEAVRAAWPGAHITVVGNGGRTSGIDADGNDISHKVQRVVNEAFNSAF
jgi:hypothetical protein